MSVSSDQEADDLTAGDAPHKLRPGLDPEAQKPDDAGKAFFTPENTDFYAKGILLPLDRVFFEIRLLRLLPGTGTEQIQCDLIPKQSGISYEALSYSAGNPEDTVTIKLCGHDFKVFTNLGAALRELRQKEPRVLWIDQICIYLNRH